MQACVKMNPGSDSSLLCRCPSLHLYNEMKGGWGLSPSTSTDPQLHVQLGHSRSCSAETRALPFSLFRHKRRRVDEGRGSAWDTRALTTACAVTASRRCCPSRNALAPAPPHSSRHHSHFTDGTWKLRKVHNLPSSQYATWQRQDVNQAKDPHLWRSCPPGTISAICPGWHTIHT